MKTVKIERKDSKFFIPAADLLAVSNAVSKDVTKHAITGVSIDCKDSAVKMAATDGHILMTAECNDRAFIGDDCLFDTTGMMIITIDYGEKAFKAKYRHELWVYGDIDTGILEFIDYNQSAGVEEFVRVGVCEFERLAAQFPDWRQVLPECQSDLPVTCFDIEKIKPFIAAKNIYIKHGSDRKYDYVKMTFTEENGPILINLACAENFTGLLMPVHVKYMD